MTGRALAALGLAALGAACGGAAAAPPAPIAATVPTVAAMPLVSEQAPPTPPAAERSSDRRPSRTSREVIDALVEVAARHELEVLEPVASETVTRERGIALIMQKTERDLPREVLAAQGELFALLELAPPDYPFVEGMFAQVRENVAGFYDPDADTLYLLDDLDEMSARPTLAHELVHALQDQHFRLGERLTYRRGEVDAMAAVGSFAEGDATSAMFAGLPAGSLSVETLRRSMVASVALSSTGLTTPAALQASLVAPYVDGYRFVEGLRARGGWAEVNRVWRDPPRTTEQLLHLEKYDAHEPPLDVAVPPGEPLGAGAKLVDADVGGEQALRIVFEQWAAPPEAAAAAAGWGGDRYALYRRDDGEGAAVALVWRLVFDVEAEAVEAAALVARRHPPCRERGVLGPFAWQRRGRELAFVAGPLGRDAVGKARPVSGASCEAARRWAASVLR